MRLSNALLVRSFPSFLLLPFSSLLFLLPLRFRCCVRLRVLASIRLSQWRLPTTRVEFSRMPRDIWRIHLAASTRNNEARRGTRTKNLFITLPFPRFLPPLLPVGFPALPNPLKIHLYLPASLLSTWRATEEEEGFQYQSKWKRRFMLIILAVIVVIIIKASYSTTASLSSSPPSSSLSCSPSSSSSSLIYQTREWMDG